MNIYIFLIFILVYIICMFNAAIILCNKKTGVDIRRTGSMDAGVFNTVKVLGRPLGVLVLITNILKVIVSYYVAKLVAIWFNLDITTSAFKSAVILGTMLGHCFPAVYKFNGGKGIFEFITLMAIFNHKYVIICVVTSIMIIALTKVIVKGTLAGCILYLILSIVMGCNYIPALVISLVIILYRHRENLQRIKYKQEEKI